MREEQGSNGFRRKEATGGWRKVRDGRDILCILPHTIAIRVIKSK
jgi:hypothetical protein